MKTETFLKLTLDIPALVLRTIVTKIAINWSASFTKGSN